MVVEATPKTARSALLKHAPKIEYDATGRRKLSATARCQGCGKEICTTKDLTGVNFVITKRGTAVFFHEDCMKKVWERKIPV